MRKLACLALLLCAASCGDPDPCAGAQTCVALRVLGDVGAIDQLDVHVSGAFSVDSSSAGNTSHALPIRVGLRFHEGQVGKVRLAVTGLLEHSAKGAGEVEVMLDAGKHVSADVTLTGGGGLDAGLSDQGVPDLGTDGSTDAAQGCVAQCSDSQHVVTCGDGGGVVACTIGCVSDTSGAHCGQFVPTAPVTVDHLGRTDVLDVTTGATQPLIVDTAAGVISSGPYSVRTANLDPTALEVINNIGFQSVGGVGVFVFRNLTVSASQSLIVKGVQPVALVATNDATIDGVIDARAWSGSPLVLCAERVPGPGGGAGGLSGYVQGSNMSGSSGMGPGGGGAAGNKLSMGGPGGGGGGGGHGDHGGVGGANMMTLGGSAGPVYASTVPFLSGGSGGGGGGHGGAVADRSGGSWGGGGGGAVQLVAGGRIKIGTGTSAGGINTGGCGGACSTGTGGGGGSGGAILVESPTMLLGANGVLAANGGGGAGGACATATGENGSLSATAAMGGDIGTTDPGAGGGAGASCQGVGSGAAFTGGGGGAAGLIKVRRVVALTTEDAAFVISPTATSGCASKEAITPE